MVNQFESIQTNSAIECCQITYMATNNINSMLVTEQTKLESITAEQITQFSVKYLLIELLLLLLLSIDLLPQLRGLQLQNKRSNELNLTFKVTQEKSKQRTNARLSTVAYYFEFSTMNKNHLTWHNMTYGVC